MLRKSASHPVHFDVSFKCLLVFPFCCMVKHKLHKLRIECDVVHTFLQATTIAGYTMRVLHLFSYQKLLTLSCFMFSSLVLQSSNCCYLLFVVVVACCLLLVVVAFVYFDILYYRTSLFAKCLPASC